MKSSESGALYQASENMLGNKKGREEMLASLDRVLANQSTCRLALTPLLFSPFLHISIPLIKMQTFTY